MSASSTAFEFCQRLIHRISESRKTSRNTQAALRAPRHQMTGAICESLENRVLLSGDVAVAYVDDNFAALTIGEDPDGAGPATELGVDAFASIQDAIDHLQAGGTIHVADGTYDENLAITKNLTLISDNGRDVTFINGISGVGKLGAITISNVTSDVQIGDIDQGFAILGIDNNAPGIENAAIYLQGAHSGMSIIGNEIIANGDHGLLTEYGKTVTDIIVDSNIFSGQTFIGANPAGEGFGSQFTLANVPRQLVSFGGGASSNNNNVTFTNNQITGTAGGLNVSNQEQGNTLVTIDAQNSTITGNTFAGTTTRYGSALRVRGSGATTITGNTFDSTNLGDNTTKLYTQIPTVNALTGNDLTNVLATNTIDEGTYIEGTTSIYNLFESVVENAPDGSVIHVMPGQYTADVTITQNDITLLGPYEQYSPSHIARVNEAVINGGFRVQGDNFTIKGFTLKDGIGPSGIGDITTIHLAPDILNAKIINNIIIGSDVSGSRGIVSSANADFDIIQNEITGWATGIYINPTTAITVGFNDIHDNFVGLSADGTSSLFVTRNFFTNNAFEHIGLGTPGTGVSIKQNSFDANGPSVSNYGTQEVNASTNWWGTNDLSVIATNLTANASGPVDYSPILDSGTDTSTSYGFYPDLSSQTAHTQGSQSTGIIDEVIASVPANGQINLQGSYTGNVTIGNGIILGGEFTIDGELILQDGATLAPGNSPAIVNTGSLTMGAGETLAIELFGTTPGTEHDQVNVTGTVDITDSTLDTTLGYFPSSAGDSYMIIANDDVDPIVGTFAGLAEGATFSLTIGGAQFEATITYIGGDGNDVVLSTTGYTLSNVYVDDDYASLSIGDDPDGAGPATAFGFDAFATIQDAIDAVTDGGTVNVAEGSYAENITIDKTLQLIGAGSGSSVIEGGNSVGVTVNAGGTSAAESDRLLISGLTVNNAASMGIVIDTTASFITIDDVDVNVAGVKRTDYGLEIGPNAVVNDLLINNSAFSTNYQGAGMHIHGSVDGLTVTDSHFDGNNIGLYSFQVDGSNTILNNVNISDSTFSDNTYKGLYIEKLSNALLDNITVLNSGTKSGTADGLAGYEVWPTGIDLNLKYYDYTNITIQNSDIIDSGSANPTNGVGLAVKTRNDGSYATHPATLDGITITGNTINGAQTSVRFGEPSKGNTGITNLDFYGNDISGSLNGIAVDNQTADQIDASGNYWGTLSWFGYDSVTGIKDRFSGDVIYNNWASADLGTLYTVPAETFASPDNAILAEGDAGDDGGVFGYNAFATIHDAYNHLPEPGGTILLDAGNYSEDLAITKNDVTIHGPNFAKSVDSATRTDEAIIDGGFRVQANDFELAGVTLINGIGPAGIGDITTIHIAAGTSGHAIFQNFIIGNDAPGSRGVVSSSGSKSFAIDHNDISGWATGIYLNAPGNFVRASYNNLHDNNVGISADGADWLYLYYNQFENSGFEHIGIGSHGFNIHIMNSSFDLSAPSLSNYDTGSINASNNWWGTTDLALIKTNMTVNASGPVDFSPILISSVDQNTSQAGFNPDLSHVLVHDLGSQTSGRITEAIHASITPTDIIIDGTFNQNIVVDEGINIHGQFTLNGSITFTDGSTFSPGNSPAIVNTGDLSMTAGTTLAIELDGSTVGTEYDQVNVTGTVDITDSTLDVTRSYLPASSDTFTIINNDGNDAVVGTFDGLAEGDTLLVDGVLLTISYIGGDGNDVTLSAATNFDVIYVDDDWAGTTVGDDPDAGGPAGLFGYNAFATINEALNAVNDGGIIYVLGGTYSQSLTINKSVSLLGANADVDPTHGGVRNTESTIIGNVTILSDDVTFNGFELTGYNYNGLTIGGQVSNIEVSYNSVHGSIGGNSAILLAPDAGSTLAGEVVALTNIDILNNYIVTNSSINNQVGIRFSGPAYTHQVQYNQVTIDSNEVTGIGVGHYGIFSGANPAGYSMQDAVITNNYIHDVASGINLGNMYNGLVDGNTIDGTSGTGASLGVINGSITNNIFTNIGSQLASGGTFALGIWGTEYGFTATSDATITGNIFNFNTNANAAISGVYTRSGADSDTIHINENSFVNGGAASDTFALLNWSGDDGMIDASNNWWSTTNATEVAALTHTSVEVETSPSVFETVYSGKVDTSPFLESGTDNDGSTAGFQGDFSALTVHVQGDQVTDNINEALASVNAGGVIHVSSGTYTEDVTVDSNVTLTGSFDLDGTLSLTDGAQLLPGNSPGVVNTGDLSLVPGTTLAIELDGPTAGTGYDQVGVTGTVLIDGATLDLTLNYKATAGTQFIIVDNDGADAIVGHFNGLPEGAIVALNDTDSGDDVVFHLTYVGGDGNDIVLTANSAPNINPVAINATEDGPAVIGNFDATDPDANDTVTYQLVDLPANGSVINNNDGTFSYTAGDFPNLNNGETTQVTFTYKAIDNNGAESAPATVTVTVAGVTETTSSPNTYPNGAVDNVSTTSDVAMNINVIANDTDPDGDTLHVHSVDLVSNLGVPVSVNPDGTVHYDPTGYFNSYAPGDVILDYFRYELQDPYGHSDTTRVNIFVTVVDNVNDAPDATNVAASAVEEGSPITVSFIADDVDSDDNPSTLIYNIVSLPTGVVNNNDGTFTYTPGDFPGLDFGQTTQVTFNYYVTDSHGADSNEATVTITVAGQDEDNTGNDAPVSQNVAGVVGEDGPAITLSFDADDVDADDNPSTLTYTILTTPTGGILTNNNDGTFSFNPDGDFEALTLGQSQNVSFTYKATDSHGEDSNVATVTITVNGANEVTPPNNQYPNAAVDSVSTDADTAINIAVLANDTDPDGDVLHVTGLETLTSAGGVPLTINADGTIHYDPNGYFGSLAPGETYTDTFRYTVADPYGYPDTTRVFIQVTGVDGSTPNVDPVAGNVDDSTSEDLPITLSFAGSDADDLLSNLTYTITSTPAAGSVINNNDGTFTFDPGSDFQALNTGDSDSVSFTYVVTDPHGAVSNTATVTITIIGADESGSGNTAPIAQNVVSNANEDGAAVIVNFNANDVDADDNPSTLTYTIVTSPTEGSVINNNNGTFTFNPGSGFQDLGVNETRQVTFTYKVTDSHGADSTTANVTITVTGKNDYPDGAPNLVSTNNDTLINIDVLGNDTDVDGDVLTTASVDLVSELGVPLSINSDGTIHYDPTGYFDTLAPGTSVRDSFRYTLTDPYGYQDRTRVFVDVTAPITVTTASLPGSTFGNASVAPVTVSNLLGNGGTTAGSSSVNQMALAWATHQASLKHAAPTMRIGTHLLSQSDDDSTPENGLKLIMVEVDEAV